MKKRLTALVLALFLLLCAGCAASDAQESTIEKTANTGQWA